MSSTPLLERLPCYDASDYRAMHHDLHSVDPDDHFLNFGLWEGRRGILPEHLTATLSRAALSADPRPLDTAAMERAYRGAMVVAPTIHRPGSSSRIEHMIADRLVAALSSVGVYAQIREDPPSVGDTDAIVLNPQQLFEGRREDADFALYQGCLVVLADQPDQPGFLSQLPYALNAGGVVAMESDTFLLFREAGTPALWLWGAPPTTLEDRPPVTHPLFDGLTRSVRNAPSDLPWADRPIEVLALESASPARTRAWVRMAEAMARFETVVYRPPSDVLSADLEASLRRFLYARSKIILHLNDDAPSSLSSVLIEEAAGGGAVILSEPCRPHLIMKPDRHYFESSARRMPDTVQSLVRSAKGARTALAAIGASRHALATRFDPEETGLALVNLLLDVRERGL